MTSSRFRFISFESSSGVRWFGIPRSPPGRDVRPTKNPPARAPGGSVGPSVCGLHGHSGPLPSQVHVPIVAVAPDDANAARLCGAAMLELPLGLPELLCVVALAERQPR